MAGVSERTVLKTVRLPRPALAMLLLLGFGSPSRGDQAETGVGLFEAGRFTEAKAVFETAAHTDPQDSRASLYLGRIFLIEGDTDAAVEWMERAATLKNDSADYHLWLGRAYGRKASTAFVLKRPSFAKKVREEFERAVALDPTNLAAHFALAEYYLKAPGFLGGSAQKANEQAEEIRKRSPLSGHEVWGMIYSEQKESAKAEQEYARALKEFPEESGPYYWAGSLYRHEGQPDKAFAMFESLLQLKKAEWPAYFEIARTALISGERLARGKESAQIYIRHTPTEGEPSKAEAHVLLGDIYEKMGRKDLARAEYDSARQLDPKLNEAGKR